MSPPVYLLYIADRMWVKHQIINSQWEVFMVDVDNIASHSVYYINTDRMWVKHQMCLPTIWRIICIVQCGRIMFYIHFVICPCFIWTMTMTMHVLHFTNRSGVTRIFQRRTSSIGWRLWQWRSYCECTSILLSSYYSALGDYRKDRLMSSALRNHHG